MKKMLLTLMSAAVIVGFGVTTLSAGDGKCGASKCGDAKKEMPAGKCGNATKEAPSSGKCGAGKCG